MWPDSILLYYAAFSRVLVRGLRQIDVGDLMRLLK